VGRAARTAARVGTTIADELARAGEPIALASPASYTGWSAEAASAAAARIRRRLASADASRAD
jgi:hypothetical protein